MGAMKINPWRKQWLGVTWEQKGHVYDCRRETEGEVLDLGMEKEVGSSWWGPFWDMGQEFRFCSKGNIKLLNASNEKDVEFYVFIF